MGKVKDDLIDAMDFQSLKHADFYDDGEPFADPAVRTRYQAVLGEFMLTFNELDDLVTKVVGYVCETAGRQIPSNLKGYASKIDLLDIVGGLNVLQLNTAPIAELREIGKMRNFLAHGHFDQNPFDGSYLVMPRNGNGRYVTATTVEEWTVRTVEALNALKLAEASYWFTGKAKF